MITLKDRRIKIIAPLENFECARQNIDLSENLVVRRISHGEIKLIRDSAEMSTFIPPGKIWALKYGLEMSYKAKTETLGESPPSSVTKKINRVISALRLYKVGDVGCNMALILDKIPFIHYSGGLPNISFPIIPKAYALTEVEIGQFKKFWNKFKTIDVAKKNLGFLGAAISRFNYTYEKQRFDDKFIDCMISFESLFLKGGEKQELGYRLSLRIAVMLAKDRDKRKEIFLDAKTAYNLRSMIVHGEDRKRINDDLNKRFVSFKELLIKMEDYLRNSIRAFLEEVSKEHKDKGKIIENLDERIFNKKSLVRESNP